VDFLTAMPVRRDVTDCWKSTCSFHALGPRRDKSYQQCQLEAILTAPVAWMPAILRRAARFASLRSLPVRFAGRLRNPNVRRRLQR
jgi:hypothetical protein